MSELINSLVVIDVHGSECALSDLECLSAAFTVAAQNEGQVAVLALIDPEVDVDSRKTALRLALEPAQGF